MPRTYVTHAMDGLRFGRLVVQTRDGSKGTAATYKCVCDCGSVAVVEGRRLRSGKVKSCGCLKIGPKTDISRHHLRVRWDAMHRRCYDPSNNRYYRYGARGIYVEARWHNFRLFLEDVESGYAPGLTLDRVDNNGPYGPENFRWATYRTQARNRDHCIVDDETIASMRDVYVSTSLTQAEIGEMFGFKRDTVKHYLRNLRARVY